jgi:hypothetical protein
VVLTKAREAQAKAEAQRRRDLFRPARIEAVEVVDRWTRWRRELWAIVFDPSRGDEPVVVAARGAFLFVIVAWGFPFVVHPLDADRFLGTPVHNVHLVFHEAGHPLFSVFGDFMGVLGGSLMQVLMPLVVAIAFLRNEDPFGAAFGLMWAGHALMDVAPYIADARALELPLLTGGTGREFEGHDWENLLLRLDLLEYDIAFGRAAHLAGAALAGVGAMYAAWVVQRQWRSRESGGPFSKAR